MQLVGRDRRSIRPSQLRTAPVRVLLGVDGERLIAAFPAAIQRLNLLSTPKHWTLIENLTDRNSVWFNTKTLNICRERMASLSGADNYFWTGAHWPADRWAPVQRQWPAPGRDAKPTGGRGGGGRNSSAEGGRGSLIRGLFLAHF